MKLPKPLRPKAGEGRSACASPPALRTSGELDSAASNEKQSRPVLRRDRRSLSPPLKDYAALLAALCAALFFRRFPVSCLDRSPAMSSMIRSSLPSWTSFVNIRSVIFRVL